MRYVLHVGKFAWVPLAAGLAFVGCEENEWGAQEQGQEEVAEPPQVGTAPREQQEQRYEQQQREQQQREQQRQQQQQAQQQQAQQGMISGEVQQVEMAKGEVTVKSDDGQEMTLKALPGALSDVDKGSSTTFQYQEYGGERWVQSQEDPQQLMEQHFEQTESVRGSVSNIDKEKGEITVEGEDIKAHPQQLQNVDSGSSVNLTYGTVEDEKWLVRVEKTQQQGGEQQGEGGGLFE